MLHLLRRWLLETIDGAQPIRGPAAIKIESRSIVNDQENEKEVRTC